MTTHLNNKGNPLMLSAAHLDLTVFLTGQLLAYHTPDSSGPHVPPCLTCLAFHLAATTVPSTNGVQYLKAPPAISSSQQLSSKLINRRAAVA
jgi:hypothetical protein